MLNGLEAGKDNAFSSFSCGTHHHRRLANGARCFHWKEGIPLPKIKRGLVDRELSFIGGSGYLSKTEREFYWEHVGDWGWSVGNGPDKMFFEI